MAFALEIQDLKKVYDNGFEALKGLSLTVNEGDFFALLGPNGAGKSTTIGIISSLIRKNSGSVKVYGYDIDTNFSKAKKFIGIVPQEFNFNMFEKVQDIVLNQAGYYGITKSAAEERCEMLLKMLNLWEKRDQQSRNLSGGMKRRLMIARALIHQPKLLILDEPTAGVDIELRRSMWEFVEKINQEGTTIILTTHYLEEAEQLCKNIAIINGGEIVENTSMRSLLKQLSREVFLLDLKDKQESVPQLDGYSPKLVDENTLEIAVEKGQSVNTLFELLSAQGVEVLSMRNKVNRLEELFVRLVGNTSKAQSSKSSVGEAKS